MLVRFCLYSVFKNLRFFEAFFVLYLLADPALGGAGLGFFEIGLLIGYQKLLTGLLEIPFGVLTDRWGRRRALVLCFSCFTLAFPLYAVIPRWAPSLGVTGLYLAQTLFALGEALRTGSHKAIMLDWADETGRSHETTRIVGVTRFFSKSSAGVAALLGGAFVFAAGRFDGLFWAATLPAAAGVVLMLSYPRWLEGERVRQARQGQVSSPSRAHSPAPRLAASGWWLELQRLWQAPAMLALLAQSVLFESQVKLAQHYLQPYLKVGLEAHRVAVVGAVGGLLIGVYYLVQDSLGGLSSILAPRIEAWLRNGRRALRALHVLAAVLVMTVAVSLFAGWLGAGVAGFVGLALLQNARRPIFVSQLNAVMDKPQRATTLSVESQARGWLYSLLAPATGALADGFGLRWAMVSVAAVLLAGVFLAAGQAASPGRDAGAPTARES